MTVTPAEKVPRADDRIRRATAAIVRGGKPDAAFGVELPGKPYLAIRVARSTSN